MVVNRQFVRRHFKYSVHFFKNHHMYEFSLMTTHALYSQNKFSISTQNNIMCMHSRQFIIRFIFKRHKIQWHFVEVGCWGSYISPFPAPLTNMRWEKRYIVALRSQTLRFLIEYNDKVIIRESKSTFAPPLISPLIYTFTMMPNEPDKA